MLIPELKLLSSDKTRVMNRASYRSRFRTPRRGTPAAPKEGANLCARLHFGLIVSEIFYFGVLNSGMNSLFILD